ncbi:E3 ubiquitin-protein ligase arih2, partial [Rhizophlyctis rosea]
MGIPTRRQLRFLHFFRHQNVDAIAFLEYMLENDPDFGTLTLDEKKSVYREALEFVVEAAGRQPSAKLEKDASTAFVESSNLAWGARHAPVQDMMERRSMMRQRKTRQHHSQWDSDSDDYEDDDSSFAPVIPDKDPLKHADSDDYEDDNSSLAPVIPDKDRLKLWAVEFIVRSMDDILKFQHKEVSHVSALVGCPPEHTATLLRHFRWNKVRLVEQYMEKPEAVAHESGVILDSSKQPKFVAVPGFMCDICCNDEVGILTLAMSCNHRFCRDCYEHYLTQKIAEEGEIRRIQCPALGCKVVVDEKTVEMVVVEDLRTKYKSLLLRTYVDDHPSFRWCPAPNCEYAVECHVPSSQFSEKVGNI